MGQALARVRESAGLTQRELAARLCLHQTSLSRLEQGNRGCEPSLLRRYLRAVGTEEAIALLASIEAPWLHLPAPTLQHPDIDALRGIEQGLCALAELETRPSAPPAIRDLASLVYARLRRIGLFLVRRDHRVAFLGETGVGKTHALCRLGGLFQRPRNHGDARLPLLDVGGGGRTVCEVDVRSGKGFAIEVEPMDPEEVQRHVRDLCRVAIERNDWLASDATTIPAGPPQEIERALLAMAGLSQAAIRDLSGDAEAIANLAQRHRGQGLLAEIVVRLALWRRTRRVAEFDGDDVDAGQAWLREVFAAVCSGRHPDFPLPTKITVTVPIGFDDSSYRLSLIDTRGSQGASLEPELLPVLRDPRTVVVFCSPWRAAPDDAITLFLRSVLQTRRETTLSTRAAILVVARQGDAARAVDPHDPAARELAEEYLEREEAIQAALARLGIGDVGVLAFDAARGRREDLEHFVAERIARLRQEYLGDASAALAAVDELRLAAGEPGTQDQADALLANLRAFTGDNRILRGDPAEVGTAVTGALRGASTHAVRTAVRGRGASRTFDIYHHLGTSIVQDVARRLPRLGKRLDGRSDLASAVGERAGRLAGTTSAVLLEVTDLEADFLAAVEHYAVKAWRSHLRSDSGLWSELEEIELTGASFKDEVAARILAWMAGHRHVGEEVEAFIQRAWSEAVISRLAQRSVDERSQPKLADAGPSGRGARTNSRAATFGSRRKGQSATVTRNLRSGRGMQSSSSHF
ncbi:helix-turn-helix domain-containing protein [Roseomonas populi]|uniref:Helix-turn-helix domain-containing protein n=1 Tax=Roseomonas populi TaxID=3121582 RepID=A0ABT1X5W5_9PROT|nr:helix-turn-helix domain-containing protein [Roseomonas pecuniae]MCR0983124.1 helix-turn-helix domain-containing protein [Roseomonas pecuniae]